MINFETTFKVPEYLNREYTIKVWKAETRPEQFHVLDISPLPDNMPVPFIFVANYKTRQYNCPLHPNYMLVAGWMWKAIHDKCIEIGIPVMAD